MFGKKKKVDYRDKLSRIERSIWELENKQLVYLDKMKAVVNKQAEYKEKGKNETDRNMQKHWASMYLSCEKEKEQIASAINAISKEIVAATRMTQLVDTQVLTIELGKTESLTLAEINEMSESVSKMRTERDAEDSLKEEAINRALHVEEAQADPDVDRMLGLWEEEKAADDEIKLADAARRAEEKAAAEKKAAEEAARAAQEAARLAAERAAQEAQAAQEQEENDGAGKIKIGD